MNRQPTHGIWLDDNRPMPKDGLCDVHVRNFSEFRAALDEIAEHGEKIDYVGFDYFLNDAPDPNWPYPHEKTGKDCARLLMMRSELLDEHFVYDSHSSSGGHAAEISKFIDAHLPAAIAGAQP